MESAGKLVLVPWDFSNVADYALQHAIRVTKVLGGKVSLVHVTKTAKEAEEAVDKMNVVLSETEKKYAYKAEFIIREGDIFTTIPEICEELKPLFVFMGTHGMKGMQKITGSWALKVIAGNEMPFIVVQKPPQDNQFVDICYPIGYQKEDKQKSVWAAYLHKHFNSKIHIFVQKSGDAAIAKQIAGNVQFTKKYFETEGIQFDVVEAEGKGDFSHETEAFAVKLKTDIILITTTKNIGIKDYMFGATEQYLIANKEGMPVMCVNPKEGKLAGFN